MKKMKISKEQYQLLEDSYYRNFPENIPNEIFSDYKLIIEYKNLIKYAKPNKLNLNYILNLVIERIDNSKGFQTATLLRYIKTNLALEFIDTEISNKLFKVFQNLIFKVNDDLKWKVTTLIKDIELSNENINWLIENWEKSIHMQNRLLRYPERNKSISNWAKSIIGQPELEERKSELIGLILNYNENFKYRDKTQFVWGIHYSKLDDSLKIKLIEEHISKTNFVEVLQIMERNGFLKSIEKLYKDNH